MEKESDKALHPYYMARMKSYPSLSDFSPCQSNVEDGETNIIFLLLDGTQYYMPSQKERRREEEQGAKKKKTLKRPRWVTFKKV